MDIANTINLSEAYRGSGSDGATSPLRILTVSETSQGSDAYAWMKAMRRLGHSVQNVPPDAFYPAAWSSLPLRVLRCALTPTIRRQLAANIIKASREFEPHLFFIFKGALVRREVVAAVRAGGAIAINFYPDVSFTVHGSDLPRTLPEYDWVLTSKSFGLADMQQQLGFLNASFLPHGFDPDIHRPALLDERDRRLFDCDVSFIGTWSPKKERILDTIVNALPEIRLKIWGNQWGAAGPRLQKFVQNREVQGIEYAKATIASRINLGLLSEIRPGASSGDLITARTFQIPATSGFMLHERTTELANYFVEDEECGCFDGLNDVAQIVKHYLAQPEKRNNVARAGYRRTRESDYSVDNCVRQMLAKYHELRGASRRVAA